MRVLAWAFGCGHGGEIPAGGRTAGERGFFEVPCEVDHAYDSGGSVVQFLAFFAGVELPVRFLQFGDRDAQVSFGRDERAVAEDFLHMAQVGLVLQQVGGARVPPDMAGHPLLDLCRLGVFFNERVERGSGQRSGLGGQEQPVGPLFMRLAVLSSKLGADRFDVRFQEPAGDR